MLQKYSIKNLLLGAKALIIGGGPTTLELDRWTDVEKDVTVLTSTAYLNSHLQTIQTDYFIISTQTDFTSEEFKKWYNNNPNCKFVIESNHLWKAPNGFNNFIFNSDPIRINITPEFGVGIMGRAIMWLIETNLYSTIYFVGFDGYAKDGSGQHAFHKHIKELNRQASINTYSKYLDNFTKFNSHIESIVKEKDISLVNLGKGHPSNILSHIESKAFV